jgi:hypothetical protein
MVSEGIVLCYVFDAIYITFNKKHISNYLVIYLEKSFKDKA